MIIVLMGPPGSGKGTHARYIAESRHMLHLSTGDLLRKEVAASTSLGVQLAKDLGRGQLVDDGIVEKLVAQALDQSKEKNFVFDGFPRTLKQVLAFDRLLGVRKLKVDIVIDLIVDLDVLIDRVCGRYACTACGAVYHDRHHQPQVEGVCDCCGKKEFVRRSDDTVEILSGRYAQYMSDVDTIREAYRSRNILKQVRADCSIQEIRACIGPLIDKEML